MGTGRLRFLALPLLAGVLFLGAIAWAVFVIGRGLPPRHVVMTTGPEGGGYRKMGQQYRKILARSGVRLSLRPSKGNVENLERLRDPHSGVSAGFGSGAVTTEAESPGVVSLGTIAYYPLWIFCRGIPEPKRLLDLKGKRVSIGPEGSGTRPVMLTLLRENKMENAITALDLAPGPSGEALLAGEIDCACMLTTADAPVVQKLLADKRIRLMDFTRADAYIARFPYLRKVVVPEGIGNLPKDLPPHDVTLIASTASLLIREDLHPAIQFLLLQAADEIHSPGGMLNKPEQFPAPEAVDVPLSAEARPFYKSGGSFLQRHLPFWLWAFTSRLLLLLIPLIGIVYPMSKAIPAVIDLVVDTRLNRLYKQLRRIEEEIDSGESRETLSAEFEHLEEQVRHLHVPTRNARALYTLRQHLSLVRQRLAQ
jgi:TRAP-type uncharacterized transport system substrate-binding protein